MIAGRKATVKGRIDFPMANDVHQGVGNPRQTFLIHVRADHLHTILVLGETGPGVNNNHSSPNLAVNTARKGFRQAKQHQNLQLIQIPWGIPKTW